MSHLSDIDECIQARTFLRDQIEEYKRINLQIASPYARQVLQALVDMDTALINRMKTLGYTPKT